MKKEIFDKELIERHRGENGWICDCNPEDLIVDNVKWRKVIPVLVSLKSGIVTVARRTNIDGCWYYGRIYSNSVVAWQPLPPVYKGE